MAGKSEQITLTTLTLYKGQEATDYRVMNGSLITESEYVEKRLQKIKADREQREADARWFKEVMVGSPGNAGYKRYPRITSEDEEFLLELAQAFIKGELETGVFLMYMSAYSGMDPVEIAERIC